LTDELAPQIQKAEIQAAEAVTRPGRGSLRGELVMAEDFDSEEGSTALARDFGIVSPDEGHADASEGLEMTAEILGEAGSAARISQSLAALDAGAPGVDLAAMRAEYARRAGRQGS
jgi:hypothetical protein